jgi:hypothetical protein
MPLRVNAGAPTLFIRKSAFDRTGVARATLDERLNLTADEFRVEKELIAVGPIYAGEDLGAIIEELEGRTRLLRRLLRAERQLARVAATLRFG